MLIVPVVLLIGSSAFALMESNLRQRLADERDQFQALQTYYDRMGELILDKGLLADTSTGSIATLAKTRTLAILRVVDSNWKRQVVSFYKTRKYFKL